MHNFQLNIFKLLKGHGITCPHQQSKHLFRDKQKLVLSPFDTCFLLHRKSVFFFNKRPATFLDTSVNVKSFLCILVCGPLF